MYIIDLKNYPELISEYVLLRNRFVKLLMTQPVGYEDTSLWLKRKDIDIRCAIEHGAVIGAAILYISRKGEVAFFSKYSCNGIGTILLRAIYEAAYKRGLNHIWSWTSIDNVPAQHAFLKNGYIQDRIEIRSYDEESVSGIVYTKQIIHRQGD